MNTADHIFVTGGTGFIGSYILRSLIERGYTSITAMRRPTSRMGLVEDIADKIQWVELDLFDYDGLVSTLASVDVVIHSAAIISFWPRARKDMFRTNVDGTAHLVNAALESNVRQFLHVSSVAALGRDKKGGPTNENHTFENTAQDTSYGLSKHLAEMEVWRGGSEGLHVSMINPAMVMGAGYWDSGTPRMIYTVAKGLRYYPLGQGGFVDVRDVAELSLRLLENDIRDEKIIACAECVPTRDVFNMMADALQVKRPNVALKSGLRALAWRAEWLRSTFTRREPIITHETMKSSARISVYDNRKSKELLNFSYRPLSRTIADSCRVYEEAQQSNKKFGILR